jgi:hypothetical protein
MKGHSHHVSGARELNDGRLLSWSADGTLRLWASDGTALAELQGHTQSIDGAIVLRDGRLLSWSGDGTLRLWGSDGRPEVAPVPRNGTLPQDSNVEAPATTEAVARRAEHQLDSATGKYPGEGAIKKTESAEDQTGQRPSKPTNPPRLWRNAHLEKMNAKDFILEVYSDAIMAGMTQADLKRVDPKLYTAFHNWCSHQGFDPQSVLPSSQIEADTIVAKHGGRRPTRSEAIAALRTGTREGLELFKAYEALGRRERKRAPKKANLG